MDNKTHMMFHDEDVREEGKMEAIRGTISLLREAGLPEDQLKSKVQQHFDLTNQQMQKLFK